MDCTFIKYLFKCLCIIATCLLVGMWLYRFFQDKDTSVIESRLYFETEDDLLPAMSMCFRQSFNDDTIFRQFGANISGEKYEKYLLGQYIDEEMIKVNYDNVTTNLSEFILSYEVNLKNGSSMWGDRPPNISWLRLHHTHSWENWGYFLKCFTLEIEDYDVSFVRLYMKRYIFPNRNGPNLGQFAAFFHYPDPILLLNIQ